QRKLQLIGMDCQAFDQSSWQVSWTTILVGALVQYVAGTLIYGPLFGKDWLGAMNKDKGNERWFPKNENIRYRFFGAFFLGAAESYVYGVLLNLTGAKTYLHAFQLGLIIFLGCFTPMIASESLWEIRPLTLIKIKAIRAAISTIGVTLTLFWWNSG
ncbi:6417_t:CDS:2, partial [Dentiscutata heterogama]